MGAGEMWGIYLSLVGSAILVRAVPSRYVKVLSSVWEKVRNP